MRRGFLSFIYTRSRVKTRAEIVEFYLTDFALRGKGYGTACMREIIDQFGKKGVTMVTAPNGYELAPLGYTGPDQYRKLIAGFYEKTGFSISGGTATLP